MTIFIPWYHWRDHLSCSLQPTLARLNLSFFKCYSHTARMKPSCNLLQMGSRAHTEATSLKGLPAGSHQQKGSPCLSLVLLQVSFLFLGQNQGIIDWNRSLRGGGGTQQISMRSDLRWVGRSQEEPSGVGHDPGQDEWMKERNKWKETKGFTFSSPCETADRILSETDRGTEGNL